MGLRLILRLPGRKFPGGLATAGLRESVSSSPSPRAIVSLSGKRAGSVGPQKLPTRYSFTGLYPSILRGGRKSAFSNELCSSKAGKQV